MYFKRKFEIPSRQLTDHHMATNWFSMVIPDEPSFPGKCLPPPIYGESPVPPIPPSNGDGDYGDITVSGGGTVWNIKPGAVGYAELAFGLFGVSPGLVPASDGNPGKVLRGDGTFGPSPAGLGVFYEYNWSNNNSPPPGSGQVRTDTTDQTLATTVWISNVTANGVDISRRLKQITGGRVFIQNKGDALAYSIFQITAVPTTYPGNYFECSVTYIEGVSGFNNNQSIIVELSI